MKIAAAIREAVARALNAAGVPAAPEDVVLEHPAEFAHGDYATGVALAFAKKAGQQPRALAEAIKTSVGTIPGVERIEIAGPGFVNFHLSKEQFNEALEDALETPALWGKGSARAEERVMVEYTQPNPFKPFHIGHLMSNAIGESISRLVEYAGAHVIRANYQGDVGPHVAKAIWGVQKLGVSPNNAEELGRAYVHGAQAYEHDPSAKAEIDALNKAIYAKTDDAVQAIYAAGRAASLEHFEDIYRMLGTKFDVYFFESETAEKGKEIVLAHESVFPLSDGARVFKGESKGLHTRVFLTSQGLPTYEAKELGLEYMKMERYPDADQLIITTAVEQKEYFNVVRAALGVLSPELAEKLVHVSHGMMRFADGKMSSRTGNVVTGESLLEDLVEVAKERAAESRADNPEKLAEQVAVAAIKYQILKQGSGKDIVFDRERALSLDGDSGPYLEYAHARATQVLERAHAQGVVPKVDPNAEPILLTRLIARFPEAVEYAARELEPHLLTTYLIELAGAFNSWYAQVQILDGSTSSPHKLALANAVRITLRNGLWLLGIPAPSKM